MNTHLTFVSLRVIYNLQAQCKAALQKELGLPIRPDCPLVIVTIQSDDDYYYLYIISTSGYNGVRRLASLDGWTIRRGLM